LAIAELLGLQEVSRPDLEHLRDLLLARFGHIGDVHFDSLDSNRSRLLAPGLCVLLALVDAFAIDRLVTADVALREGVALAWYQGDQVLRAELSPGIAI
jgi:exopolyphosphatase/pppGpp-phosphohydrolase